MDKKLISFLFVSFTLLNSIIVLSNSDKMYKNPLDVFIADPFVLKVENTYYLYGTSAANVGFKVWKSEDLVNWEEEGFALTKFQEENQWAQGDFWAPEVISYRNRFYMVYSARDKNGKLQIGLAASDSPLGPFLTIKAPLINDGYSNIDGHIFIDSDGRPYLFWVRDCSENIIDGIHLSQIYVQEMSENLLELKGEPILALEPSQQWEGLDQNWQWNEGPFVIKNNEIYYLLYSANYFGSPDYSVGYAVSKSLFGPWEKSKDNPVLIKDLSIGVSGPGHCSVTTSPSDFELFIVYHTHAFPQSPGGIRVLNIDRIYFEKNGALIVKGPTRTPQPFPE